MRVVSENVTALNIDGFANIGQSSEKVSLEAGGLLKAGNTWKGRLVSLLETVGIFREYCVKAKLEMADGNRKAAWTLWNGLKEKYGLQEAKEALARTSPSLHGMDGIKVRQGIISRNKMGEPGSLTCGEITSLLRHAEFVHSMRENEARRLNEQVPDSEHEAAYYNPKDTHTAGLSNSIQNHQRVKDFVGKREKLLFIMHELGADPERLKQSRVDYVMSRVLKEVDSAKQDGVFTKKQIYRMTENALKESLQHKASWSRAQALKMGFGKRTAEASSFTKDFAVLKEGVNESARRTVTYRYVQSVAHELKMPVTDSKAKSIAKHVIKEVTKAVDQKRIELNEDDFKRMVSDEIQKKVLSH